jgi:uncharacterized Zn finger protein
MAHWDRPRARSRWANFDRFSAPSIPLPAIGGIRARSKIGEFATSWWGRRWIQTLESFQLHSRLTRGRKYARRGQVLDLEITNHKVTAAVQGSIPIPYQVTIELRRITLAQWRKVGKAMAAKVAIAARLIAGALPPEAEACFAEAHVALFPRRAGDLNTSCDCPDPSNPCKHIAAVYYLLAEQFDRDPFLLFRLRGMEREQFVAMLGDGERDRTATGIASVNESQPAVAKHDLATNVEVFWRGRPFPDERYGEVALYGEGAPVARRLGSFPFWRGSRDFLEAVSDLSSRAAEHALSVLARSSEDVRESKNA